MTMKHDDKIEISVTKFITWWIICAAWLAIGFNFWNQKAWDTRYPADVDPDDSFNQVNETQPTNCNIPQLLKALECIDYQCSDADEWEASEHKQFLDLICNDCRDYLISELPEYKAAKWGIE